MVRVTVALVFALVAPAAAESSSVSSSDLVDVAEVIPDAVIDLRYATADNITGEVLYPRATCKLRRAVAARLARAAKMLRAERRRLVLWDCYRPDAIQQILWDRMPDPRYVADPKVGSRHNRGAAVDVALADEDGALLGMPTAFDDFSRAAHRTRALRGAKGAEARRLARAMTKAGFVGLATEWWHFDAPGTFPRSNDPL